MTVADGIVDVWLQYWIGMIFYWIGLVGIKTFVIYLLGGDLSLLSIVSLPGELYF